MSLLYKNKAIHEIESHVIANKINDEYGLMELAGKAAFDQLLAHWPKARRILVCCGKGNNGGDGFVVARLAYEHGLNVRLYMLSMVDELSGSAKKAALACRQAGVQLEEYHDELELQSDLIVDALLGSGLTGEVSGHYATLIAAINAASSPVLSLDVPSGLEVDTGQILDTLLEVK